MEKIQKVKAFKDDDGHWYVIPNELAETFYTDLENGEADEWESFNAKYAEYRTGGDLNLVQLYAEAGRRACEIEGKIQELCG